MEAIPSSWAMSNMRKLNGSSSEANSSEIKDDLRSEYDLSQLLRGGERGKYAVRFWEGNNLVLLDPDLAEAFPNDAAVNRALRLVFEIASIPSAATDTLDAK